MEKDMDKVIVEPAADQPKEELVAEYKSILQGLTNLRPSGTRMKIAQALNKNKSFVSQITNPSYSIPVPAKHLSAIFDICRFSFKERETFLKAYTAAHPNYHYRVETTVKAPIKHRKLIIEIPMLKDHAEQRKIEEMIRSFAHQLFELVLGKK